MGTSLAFSAGVVEVFAQAQILGGADYRYFERFISVVPCLLGSQYRN